MAKPKFGMVHGRFQPFHNGHLEYAAKALDLCESLIVGITNPDPGEIRTEATSEHRHLDESNPYTFFQRMQMVHGALLSLGAGSNWVRIIPFHIHSPEKWRYYLPAAESLVHYVRVFSDWEQLKVDRLRDAGYVVEVLDPGVEKGIDASRIRGMMDADDDGWRALVPAAVARVIDDVVPAPRSR
jgi:cytidyltransferase-like protein